VANTPVVVVFQEKSATGIDGGGEKPGKAFLTAHGYTLPSLLDPRMEVTRKFGVCAVPTTYVMNRARRVVAQGLALTAGWPAQGEGLKGGSRAAPTN